MIRSMTGFGRAEKSNENYRVTVELKSVNSRYLDFNIKLPPRYGYLESGIRSALKTQISRGKIDVYVSYEESADENATVLYHKELAANYVEKIREMANDFDMDFDLRASHLSRYPEVLEIREESEDESVVWDRLKPVLDEAISNFVNSREVEGENLKDDLLGKLETMDGYVAEIEKRSPEIVAAYKARLIEKVRDLLEDHTLEESRIVTEVTLYADKICIDEELVRLKSHIKEAKRMLREETEVGRKLDFLAQEMNRESNTILSKSTDVLTADIGIEQKTLVEKIREQIQNLE